MAREEQTPTLLDIGAKRLAESILVEPTRQVLPTTTEPDTVDMNPQRRHLIQIERITDMHKHTLALRYILRIEPTGCGDLIIIGKLVNRISGQQVAHIDRLVVGDIDMHALAIRHEAVAEQDLDGIENVLVGCAMAHHVGSGCTGNLGGLGAVLDDLHAAHIGGVRQIPCERNRTPICRIAEIGSLRQIGIRRLLQLNTPAG